MSGGKFDQIRQACERARAGDWSHEELDGFVQALLGKLRAQKEAIAEYVAETAYEGHQEVEVGLSGAEKFEQGLEKILASKDQQAIDDGLKLISEGDSLINQAMGLNREERRKLEEE